MIVQQKYLIAFHDDDIIDHRTFDAGSWQWPCRRYFWATSFNDLVFVSWCDPPIYIGHSLVHHFLSVNLYTWFLLIFASSWFIVNVRYRMDGLFKFYLPLYQRKGEYRYDSYDRRYFQCWQTNQKSTDADEPLSQKRFAVRLTDKKKYTVHMETFKRQPSWQ